MTRERQWHALLYVVLAAGGLVVALPFLYALSTSFKTSFDALRIPIEWIPREWHFENYTLPFRQRPIARYFLNSVGVSSAVTLLNLVTCTMAGYSFAKFSYIGRDLLFSGVLASLMVPIQVIVVPLFILVKGLGWLDSYTGLIVPAGTSAFGVFLMRQYLLGVPRDFIEAARIDGAGEVRILAQIVVPMVRPALSALAIFIFMNNWNSFLWPLLVVQREEMMTLPLGIAGFESVYSTDYGQLMAVSILATAPVLLVFLLLQREFIQAMALSGLKQ